MSGDAIEVEGLVKRYGALRAVDGVSFRVRRGETLAIVGDNGAGKTTTVEIIATVRRATEGSVRVLGHDVVAEASTVRQRIGILPEGFLPSPRLTVEENLRYLAKLYPEPVDLGQLLDAVGLRREARKPGYALSAGNQRRLGIAAALLGDPDVVLLDEPSASLDPAGRLQVRDLVARLEHAGKTVVITSHDLAEVQAVSSRVVIFHRGRIMDQGTPSELIHKYRGAWTVRIRTSQPDELLRRLGVPGVAEVNRVVLEADGLGAIGKVIARLEECHVDLGDIEVAPPSLWHVFERTAGAASP